MNVLSKELNKIKGLFETNTDEGNSFFKKEIQQKAK